MAIYTSIFEKRAIHAHLSEAISMKLAYAAILPRSLLAVLQAGNYSLFIFAVLAAGRAEAQSWKNFTANDFPSRVRAIVFQGGAELTGSHSVRFGKWSVSFGTNVGAFYKVNDLRFIFVRGLECANDVAGTIPCHLVLGYSPKAVVGAPWYATCSFHADDDTYKGSDTNSPNRILDITCPAQLRLQ
jgi:hypothetical protein